MSDTRLMWITEIHNFGGFFGGDTVTLSAVPWPAGEETTLTIDEKALENIQTRHLVAPDMLLELSFAGERIERGRLRAARSRTDLDQARGHAPTAATLDGPRIRAYHCSACDIWVDGQPVPEAETMACGLCHEPLI